jgi:uncharacterized protein YdeI (BOF family)
LNKIILISFLLVGLILAVVGCAQAGTLPDNQPGTPNLSGNTPVVESPKVLKIVDVLGKPENYQGQAIIVEGKIITECPSGCWFTLDDNTGTIYVDLLPSNLVIPQKRGAFARVYGQVVRKGSDTYLIGTKVEF